MLFDPAHFLQRLIDPFNSESRFYWPAVVGLLLGIALNIAWYYYRPRRNDEDEDEDARISPAEENLKAWAVWANLITIIWSLILVTAKVPFLIVAISFAIDIGVLVYLYGYYLPPRNADWLRELRRQRYIPKLSRKRR